MRLELGPSARRAATPATVRSTTVEITGQEPDHARCAIARWTSGSSATAAAWSAGRTARRGSTANASGRVAADDVERRRVGAADRRAPGCARRRRRRSAQAGATPSRVRVLLEQPERVRGDVPARAAPDLVGGRDVAAERRRRPTGPSRSAGSAARAPRGRRRTSTRRRARRAGCRAAVAGTVDAGRSSSETSSRCGTGSGRSGRRAGAIERPGPPARRPARRARPPRSARARSAEQSRCRPSPGGAGERRSGRAVDEPAVVGRDEVRARDVTSAAPALVSTPTG